MGNTKPIHSKFTKDKGNESKHTTTQNHQSIKKAEEEERKELQNSQENKQNGNRKFTSVNNDLNINTKFSNQTQ